MDLDWDIIGTALTIAAAAVPVAAAVFGLVRATRKAWNYTLGQRRNQQAMLNRLAAQSTRTYVDDLLGNSQFLQVREQFEIHYYRLAGCWVCVWYSDDQVAAFAITITRKRLWFDTLALTHYQFRIRLGRDDLQSLKTEHDHEKAWVGARRMAHARKFYFGNPGAYQTYWLSYNDAGVGGLEPAQGSAYMDIDDEHPPARSTANTLIVIGPATDLPLEHDYQFGVDLDTVRLAVDQISWSVRRWRWKKTLTRTLTRIRALKP